MAPTEAFQDHTMRRLEMGEHST